MSILVTYRGCYYIELRLYKSSVFYCINIYEVSMCIGQCWNRDAETETPKWIGARVLMSIECSWQGTWRSGRSGSRPDAMQWRRYAMDVGDASGSRHPCVRRYSKSDLVLASDTWSATSTSTCHQRCEPPAHSAGRWNQCGAHRSGTWTFGAISRIQFEGLS